jgi:DNA repair protein SbcC/Rad50
MVPARLTLRNFLSYADACPPLELEGIGLACLCGDNGHGKSSLIDAITWALWGRARGRDLDALVHRGRREMEVDFEFLAGGSRYRVVRRRQRIGGRGGGRPGLEFQAWNGDGWSALTEPTIAQTEQAIERTLHLSYETFINSALLLQGKADLFAAAGPTNRKRVLAEILDLATYDRLEAEARERRKRCTQETIELERLLSELQSRSAPLAELKRQLCAAQAEMHDVQAERAGLVEELRELEAAQAALAMQRAALVELERQHGEDRRSLDAVETELAAFSATLAADQALLAAAPAIRRGFERLERAREAERQWAEKLIRLQELERQMQPLQQRMAGVEARFQEQLAVLRARREEATREAHDQRCLEEQYESLRREERAVDDELAGADTLRRSQHERDVSLARLRSEEYALGEALAGIESQRAALRDAEDGAVPCPTCRAPLTPDAVRELACRLRQQGDETAARLGEVRRAIGEAEAEIGRLAREEAEIRMRCTAEQRRLRDAIGRTGALLDRARAAAERLRSITAELEEAGRQAERAVMASDASVALRRLAEERGALGYDRAKHRAASGRVEQLREYEVRHQELAVAIARRDANRPAQARQEALAATLRGRIGQRRERLESLARAVAEQPDRTDRIGEAGERLTAVEERRTALDRLIGGLETRLRECEGLREREEQTRTALERARREESIYVDLVTAFGRNGVQAFIVDAVVPEIEAEANRLLEMMSDGRMRVRLETQRATRAGDLAETLDIVIADESGPRDYEMYSGGEAFRINLALRIALSKLLARRAGAPLPTLIIDEGFGSQDATGRERLIEAVSAIRDDFQCLLVVTHIEEMKQQFDTRIEVRKGERGSVAEVVRV